MRSALPAVAVATLLVLAGCSGTNPIPDPDGTETTSHAPEKTRYPPGVDESGVVSPSRLLAAHRGRVSETGAVVETNHSLVVHRENETVTLDAGTVVRSTPGLTRVHRVQEFDTVADDGSVVTHRQVVYANETTVFLRTWEGDNVTVTREPRENRTELVERDVTKVDTLRTVLVEHDFHVVGTERRDGHTVTTLAASETKFIDGGTQRFEATVEVAATGHILSLSVTRNPDTSTPADRHRTNISWSNGTVVEPPEWVP